MNLKESPRRLWALIGVGATALIVAMTYLLLISGQNSTKADLESQAESARQVAATSHSKLVGLQKDNANLPKYKTQLAALTAALPKKPESAQLVADLQRVAGQSGTKITSINVTPPITGEGATATKVAGATPLSVAVSLEGTSQNLEKYLGLLQTSAARAVLVSQFSETVPDSSDGKTKPTMTISLNAYFGRG